MREELFEEILSLVEEYICELDTETVQAAYDKRRQNSLDADNELAKALRDPDKSEEELDVLRKKASEADKKFSKSLKLVGARNKRHEKAIADFKKRYADRGLQTAAQTQQAGSEHANAMIDQHLRNKLEKAFSNECFESLISLIEGELIDFQQKRKQKVLDRNAEKMAQMMQDGSLNAVRVLPNKELIGDPAAIKKVKDIQAENEEVIRKCRKHG
jgi:hypothetical protein